MGKSSPAVIAYVSTATLANPLALEGRLHAACSKWALQMLYSFGAMLPLEQTLTRCVDFYSKLEAAAAAQAPEQFAICMVDGFIQKSTDVIVKTTIKTQ